VGADFRCNQDEGKKGIDGDPEKKKGKEDFSTKHPRNQRRRTTDHAGSCFGCECCGKRVVAERRDQGRPLFSTGN